jgi:hypothetical protein
VWIKRKTRLALESPVIVPLHLDDTARHNFSSPTLSTFTHLHCNYEDSMSPLIRIRDVTEKDTRIMFITRH